MKERRGEYRILVGKPEGRDLLEDLGIDWRILLEGIFKKWNGYMDLVDLAVERDR
jgi:hypothetical protein